MIRLTQAIVAVMACTVASGVAGGIVGVSVGTFAPAFVLWLQRTPGPGPIFDPTEFGLGLGIVSGLFFGAGVGSLLVLGLARRLARPGGRRVESVGMGNRAGLSGPGGQPPMECIRRSGLMKRAVLI